MFWYLLMICSLILTTFYFFIDHTSACGCMVAVSDTGYVYGVDYPSGNIYEIYRTNRLFVNLARDTKRSGTWAWSYIESSLVHLDVCNITNTSGVYSRPIYFFQALATSPNEENVFYGFRSNTYEIIEFGQGSYTSAPFSAPNSKVKGAVYSLTSEVIYEVAHDNVTGSILYKQYIPSGSYDTISLSPYTISGVDYLRCNGSTDNTKLAMLGDNAVILEMNLENQIYTIISDPVVKKGFFIQDMATFAVPCCELCPNSPAWQSACGITPNPTRSPTLGPSEAPTKSPSLRPSSSPTPPTTTSPTAAPVTITSPPAIYLTTADISTTDISTSTADISTSTADIATTIVAYTTNNPTPDSTIVSNNPITSSTAPPTPVTISNPDGSTTTTINFVTTRETSSKKSETSGAWGQVKGNTGIMIGISLGMVIILLLCGMICWQRRKLQKQKQYMDQISQQVSNKDNEHKESVGLWENEQEGRTSTQTTEFNTVRKQESVASHSTHDASSLGIDAETRQVIQAIVVIQQNTKDGPTPVTTEGTETKALPATKQRSAEMDPLPDAPEVIEELTTRQDPNVIEKPKKQKITPRKESEDTSMDHENEDEIEGLYEGTVKSDEELYEFLKDLELSKYYQIIYQSGWSMHDLIEAYEGTSQSTEELKTLFYQNWNMTLEDRLRLITAIKIKKEQLQKQPVTKQ